MRSSETLSPRARLGLGALAFALPVLLVLGWAELSLRRLPTSYTLKRDGFRAQAARLEVLVLGASEAHQGVATEPFGRPAYNLANVGQGLAQDEALLAWALPQAPRLRWALLGLSVQSLGYELSASPESWRVFLYEQAFGMAPPAKAQWLDLRRWSALLFYGLRPGFRHLASVEPLPAPLQLGPGGQERRDCLDEDLLEIKISPLLGERRAREHEALFQARAVPANLQRLGRMRAALAAGGARLAVFLPPLSRAYADALDPAALSQQRRELAAWAAQHGVPVLDHGDDPSFDDADFFDVDHLCSRGSDALARALASDLARLEGATR